MTRSLRRLPLPLRLSVLESVAVLPNMGVGNVGGTGLLTLIFGTPLFLG